MRIVIAKLKTRTMPNGHEVIARPVPIGKEYRIDLDSQRKGTLFNQRDSRLYDLQIVRIVGAPKGAEWMALDLLEVSDVTQISKEDSSNESRR